MRKKSRLRLLLIEDNPGDAELVKEYLLESQVYTFLITHCVRISEALKYLKEGENIDVILSDVGLPDTVGIETFRKLHNASNNTPLVFMTGTIPDEEAAIQALKEGAQDYLVKGQFTPDLLLRSIRYAIERKQYDIEKSELIKKEQNARKQTEIEKDKLKLEINERKKLEKLKDEFIGIASHELKTPVTSLKAFGQVLQNRFAKEGQENSVILLGKMDAQINKLTNLIQDLLDISKIEGGRLQFHNDFFAFDELVAEVIEEIQRTTVKHKLINNGTTGKTIFGDRERIGQVIINFLTNAIKYSPHSDKIVIYSSVNKLEIKLCVEDFGVGIPKESIPHIFERFYRVKGKIHDTVPGMGIGLYISSEIIKRQGGHMWAESKKGKGTTFCFTLPLKGGKKVQQKNTLVKEEMKHE